MREGATRLPVGTSSRAPPLPGDGEGSREGTSVTRPAERDAFAGSPGRARERSGGAKHMATQQTMAAGRLLVAPSVILLFAWMLGPLARTLYFAALHYNLVDGT